MSESGQSLLSHDGLKSCDVRCWSDSCQKIAGPRIQRSVFAAAKRRRHSIKSSTLTGTSHSRNGRLWNIGPRAALLRLDVGSPYHLDPFFGLISNQLAEIRGRTAKDTAAEVGDACL